MSDIRHDVPADLTSGLDGDRLDARRALVHELLDTGSDLAEVRAANDENRLPLLPVERTLRGSPTLTTPELIARSGVDPELFERILQVAGVAIPEQHVVAWEERDVALPAMIAAFVDAGTDPEALVELSRTLGESAARIGAAAIIGIGAGLTREGDTEHELAMRLADAVGPVDTYLGEAVGTLIRAHAVDQLQATEIHREQIEEGQLAGARPITIGFADVVGFTKMGEQLGAERLQDVSAQLSAIAGDVTAGGVRVIKTIGDAVMLAGPRPAEMIETLLTLQQRAADQPDFPRLRAGIASGDAVPRAGDWFGPPVNRAARICATARPSSVLVDDDTRRRIDDEALRWTAIGTVRLKGLGRVVLHRVRYATPSSRSGGRALPAGD
jgi:adenylate cyclase